MQSEHPPQDEGEKDIREPCDQVSHVATYSQQALLKKNGVLASDKEKTQQYVKQMYHYKIFNQTEICKWECKDDADNMWALAKTYFENLFTENQTFQDNMGAGKSGFESANNVEESRS